MREKNYSACFSEGKIKQRLNVSELKHAGGNSVTMCHSFMTDTLQDAEMLLQLFGQHQLDNESNSSLIYKVRAQMCKSLNLNENNLNQNTPFWKSIPILFDIFQEQLDWLRLIKTDFHGLSVIKKDDTTNFVHWGHQSPVCSSLTCPVLIRKVGISI